VTITIALLIVYFTLLRTRNQLAVGSYLEPKHVVERNIVKYKP